VTDHDVTDDYEDYDEIGGSGAGPSADRARAVTEFLARELVEDTDAVAVTASPTGGEVTLLIHASPADLGRLIGRRGRVIQAVRQLARAAGTLDGARVNVEVAE